MGKRSSELSMRLRPELREQLERFASQADRSMARVVEAALVAFFGGAVEATVEPASAESPLQERMPWAADLAPEPASAESVEPVSREFREWAAKDKAMVSYIAEVKEDDRAKREESAKPAKRKPAKRKPAKRKPAKRKGGAS